MWVKAYRGAVQNKESDQSNPPSQRRWDGCLGKDWDCNLHMHVYMLQIVQQTSPVVLA